MPQLTAGALANAGGRDTIDARPIPREGAPMSARTLPALAVTLALPAAAAAQVTCTLAATGTANWFDATAWSPQVVPNNGTPPGATYNAVVGSGGSALYSGSVAVQRVTLSAGVLSGTGTLTVNESMTWSGGRLFASFATGGTLTVGGGLSIAGGGDLLMGNVGGPAGTLSLTGGESVWSSGNIRAEVGNRILNRAGSTFTIAGDNTISSTSFTLGILVENAGTMRKQGGTGVTQMGNVTLRNTGTVEVLTGALSGTGLPGQRLENTGTITVGPGAFLNGNTFNNAGGVVRGGGTIAGPVPGGSGDGTMQFSAGSTLSPGVDGPGVLTAGGAVGLGGTLAVDLNGPQAGASHDQLNLGAGGSVSLSGATLAPSLGYAPSPGDALAVLFGVGAGTQITGTFANAPAGQFFTVGTFEGITYEARATYSAHAVTLGDFRISAIPEPGGLALAGLAAAALWRVRRRAGLKSPPSAAGGPG